MPATRSRRETRVLLALALAGAVAAIAMFGFALHLAGVNASAAQRADFAGVPHWAVRPRSVDPICDWIAVAGVAIAIGAAAMLLAGKRAPRLPGGSTRRWTIDLLWKCGAWSFAGHALLAFAFTPLADADDPVEYYESYDIIDDEQPSDLPEDYVDGNPIYTDGPYCCAGTPVLTPVLASIRPAATAWRPVVAQAHTDPFTWGSASWNDPVEPVVLGIPPTPVANERSMIRRTMTHQLPQLAECYTHARTEGAGTIIATFTIGSSGAVTNARANGFDPAVAACVAKLVRQSHFARPSDGAESEVRLPISFRGRGY
jgi:hypothetical protein